MSARLPTTLHAPSASAIRSTPGRHMRSAGRCCSSVQRAGRLNGQQVAVALRAELAALFALRPMAHWAERFESVDACVTPVLRLGELEAHPVHAGSQPIVATPR